MFGSPRACYTAPMKTESGPPRHLAQATLTIDLDAIVANWRLLAAQAAPAECSAVVKADAYGTGVEQVAPALAQAGCRTFFVAQASEAVFLRKLLPDAAIRIYALNGIANGADTVRALLDANIRPVLFSAEDLVLWLETGAAAAGAGLQFSTGMNRLGFAPDEAAALAASLGVTPAASPRLQLDFVMSHYVSSEIPDDPCNRRQIDAFEAVRAHFPGVPASMANSSGIFLRGAPAYDLARPGYALYGGNPTPGAPNPMRPVVTLEAPVLQVRAVAVGESCGYNATWMARRPSRLATIGVGYADGLLRSAAAPGKTGARAMVGGIACPFAGRVSMDLIILDVTDVPAAALRRGAPVVLIGPDTGIDDLAAQAGTIGYEILTGLGRRYNRIYIQS